MNEANTFIDSTASVANHLLEEHNIKAKPREVRVIMRDELGMRYRKIKEVSPNANSEKNLVLRQQFAMELIKIF